MTVSGTTYLVHRRHHYHDKKFVQKNYCNIVSFVKKFVLLQHDCVNASHFIKNEHT